MIRPVLTLLLFAYCCNCPVLAQDLDFGLSYYTSPTMKTLPSVEIKIGDTQMSLVGKKPKDFGTLTIPFASMDKIAYESVTRHELSEGASLMHTAPIAGPIAGILVAGMTTTSSWLDIQYHDSTGEHTAAVQLNIIYFPQVLRLLAAKTGKTISGTNGDDSDLNLPSGSKDMDETVAYPANLLIAAIKPAMADVGCGVTVEKPDRIECKRPRGGSELTGPGGEKVVATFESKGNQTSVHIETDRGFNGHMMKKNWSTPIFHGMLNKLQQSASPKI